MSEASLSAEPSGDEALGREMRRDHGLVRGIGSFAFGAAIVNAVVGAGIFTLPGRMAQAAGPYAWAAYLACAVAIAATVLCFAEAGSRVPTSGGITGYVDAAFGPLTGFVAGVLLWLSSVLASAGIADALAGAIGGLAPALADRAAHDAIILLVVGGLAALNLGGAGPAARFLSWGTAVKLVPLAVVVIVGALFVDPGKLHAGVRGEGGGFGHAVLLSLFAFQGSETAIAASGEVRDPARAIPRALIGSMAFVALLYMAIQLVAQGLLGVRLAGAANPLADAMATIDPRLGGLLLVGAVLSMTAWIGSDLLGAPRILFAFARDGLLPAALGRVQRRTRVPHIAILTHAAVVILLAVTGSFEQLAILSVLSSNLLYMLAAAAAWRLRRQGMATAGTPIRVPGLPLIAAFNIAVWLCVTLLARPAEIGGLIGAVAAAMLLYAGVRRPWRRRA